MGWIVFLTIVVAVFVGVAVKLYMNQGADISPAQLLERIEKKSDVCILDVRSAREYSSGHIPGAINVGHEEISARLDELKIYKDKEVVVYCELGVRARMAQRTLGKAGFGRVYHLAGDMAGWRSAGLSMGKPHAETAE